MVTFLFTFNIYKCFLGCLFIWFLNYFYSIDLTSNAMIAFEYTAIRALTYFQTSFIHIIDLLLINHN